MTDPDASRPPGLAALPPHVEDSVKVSREIENPWRLVFRILGLEIQLSFRPVDLCPLEGANLPHPHAAIIGQRHGDLSIVGEGAS